MKGGKKMGKEVGGGRNKERKMRGMEGGRK
jgi:hypothetical protein